MNISQKIKKVWKNKWKILEGIWINHIVWPWIKDSVRIKVIERRAICLKCPHYDKNGSGEKVILKGFPACGICGCNIKEKTACLSCYCALRDEGKEPKWEAINVKDDIHNKAEEEFG